MPRSFADLYFERSSDAISMDSPKVCEDGNSFLLVFIDHLSITFAWFLFLHGQEPRAFVSASGSASQTKYEREKKVFLINECAISKTTHF